MTVDGERLARIDRDLEALGKSAAELDALRARVPKGTALDEVDRVLAELAGGSNGSAARIARAPSAPAAARGLPPKKKKAEPAPAARHSEPVTEGRRTEELIDVEQLRVDQPPPAPRVVPGTGRKLPSAPPPPSKRPSGPMPAVPMPSSIPRSAVPPPPPAAPPPETVSVKVALPAPEPGEDDMTVGDEELYESPRASAPGTASAIPPASSPGSLSVDDLFGGVDDPFAGDMAASGGGGGQSSLADLLDGSSSLVASEGLGPLNLSDELEADMTAVYTGEEMRALGSIPPPGSAEDLDAELDAFTASQRPPARPSQRPLRAEEFGPDPFAEEPATEAAAETSGEGGDFELLIDDEALAGDDEDVVASPESSGPRPGESDLDFPDEVRTQLEAAPAALENAEEDSPEPDQPKKKGFFRKMFGK